MTPGQNEYEEYVAYVERHEGSLKPYAMKSLNTEFAGAQSVRDYYQTLFKGGDEFSKNRYRWRTPFQLDRDSVLYSSLFSRLSEKTQLYTGRGRVENRMTHTLKVAQLARSICRSLFLNEDLGEAVAFGHDCGHTPYAHIGETALNLWLEERLGYARTTLITEEPPILGKVSPDLRDSFQKYYTYSNAQGEQLFMHGRQSVRLLTSIRKENVDKSFTTHTLFGIWRHSTKNFQTDETFSYRQNTDENTVFLVTGERHSSIEAQAVRFADDIAWIISDITEGLRSPETLCLRDIDRAFTSSSSVSLTKKAELMEYLRVGNYVALYTFFVTDLIKETGRRLTSIENIDPKAIQRWKQYVSFSDEMEPIISVLKDVIKRHIISTPWVYRGDSINKERIRALCQLYFDRPNDFLRDVETLNQDPDFPFKSAWYRSVLGDQVAKCLAITDFISVLTDDEVARLSETVPSAFRV